MKGRRNRKKKNEVPIPEGNPTKNNRITNSKNHTKKNIQERAWRNGRRGGKRGGIKGHELRKFQSPSERILFGKMDTFRADRNFFFFKGVLLTGRRAKNRWIVIFRIDYRQSTLTRKEEKKKERK